MLSNKLPAIILMPKPQQSQLGMAVTHTAPFHIISLVERKFIVRVKNIGPLGREEL